MSYYTDFRFAIYYDPNKNTTLESVRTALIELTEVDQEDHPLFDQIDEGDSEIRSYGEIKWYDHHLDCCELSRLFPGIIFRLEGTGQERGDDWYAYYKDGLAQMSRAQQVYPAYNPNGYEPPLVVESEDTGRFYWYQREIG